VTLTWHLRPATPVYSSWTAFCARQTVMAAVNRFCESVPLNALIGKDDRDGRGNGLLDVERCQRRAQTFLRFLRP
jgi:hypothetical protein